ncbi:hypothetical protein SK128_025267 [Halocaridina rubra]|uniref:Nuclear respiratory factor 1 NLS/DNA-binding dimerisation domain-containing protein n=1 Tax=Halocaridina rubra TaxID=373956 RepID=A0AAN8XQ85_HALRR
MVINMDTERLDAVEPPPSGTGVMVSNLPLLFTRGFPSSLHSMKLDELEDFVPFMVRCSLGEENPVPWSQLPRPSWWPRKLPFRIPSANSPAAKRLALLIAHVNGGGGGLVATSCLTTLYIPVCQQSFSNQPLLA